MSRFFKVFTLLIVSLFLLVSGVDATLDHLSSTPDQSSYTIFDNKGDVVASYTGDLRNCKLTLKPGRPVRPEFIPRS